MATEKTDPIGAALVVGGGIAGVQASIDLANAGMKVYLAEKSPAIGGKMAQLDKTFPTNDCAICIISPKLAECARHPNITILTNAELTRLDGKAGNFTAQVHQNPRYVDAERCTSCDDCTEVCPVLVPDEFNEALAARKAIYRPYAQAVPSTFVIDKQGRAPCTAACPAGVSAQGYIALIRQKRYAAALRLIRERIPFASVCGRTCHHPCEGQCNRRHVDEPVAIQALKRFVTDYVYLGHLPPPEPIPQARPQRVAIVGAGPAGLTAAQDLVKLGYGVTVFEALPEAGGMMRFGIPEHRLPKDVLRRDISDILALGVELKTSTPVRNPLALREQGYDAVFLAVGIYEEITLEIEGENLNGVTSAIELLRHVNLGEFPRLGSRVAVVGGGITAVDAATTALRLGASEVYLVYRRERGQLPAYGWELDEAEAEGVRLLQKTVPLRIIGRDGHVTSLECAATETRGLKVPEPVPGTEFIVEVDTVIRALGQSSDLWHMSASPDAWLGDSETLATEHPGVFASPGRMPGAGFIINAIAQGHHAATFIHRYLQGEPLAQEEPPEIPTAKWSKEESLEKVTRGEITPMPRQARSLLPLEERAERFVEVDLGFTQRQALAEAERCLDCGICSECGECALACKANAIHYDDAESAKTLNVGAVILATGYSLYNPERAQEYGFGRYPNVVTAMQYERLLSASGPTSGHIQRPSDGSEAKRIAWLQCIGSRDQEHDYCSSVCCMYATKEALLTLEHVHGADCHVFMMDMRAFSKGFDAYFARAQEQGIAYHRCRISSLKEDPKTRNLIVAYTDGDGTLREANFDLVVLSVGMEIPEETRQLAERLGVSTGLDGFVRPQPFHPMETGRPGVFMCGALSEPKDIPDSVVEASGAAAAALEVIGKARGTQISPRVLPPETPIAPTEEPRVGVFVCSCGSNIAGVVDVAEVTRYAATLPGVVHAENTIYSCSPDSLKVIKERVQEHNLNRVVVASCTPRTHEPLFRETIREAGLNPYLFEMANIRDQCSWVHSDDPATATDKSELLVRMAVWRARLLEPLYTEDQSLFPRALVVGGGTAGMTAALSLAEQDFPVYLVERADRLGGLAANWSRGIAGGNPSDYISALASKVQAHPNIEVLLETHVVKTQGFIGNFQTTIVGPGHPRQRMIEHGVTIVATGGREYRGPVYKLGDHPDVVTQGDLERVLAELEAGLHPDHRLLEPAATVAMLQCVGPWDEDPSQEFYCSRFCCATAIKNALRIKALNPDAAVLVLYKDIRTYGMYESLYTEARRAGVLFVRIEDQQKPRLDTANGRLHLEIYDAGIGQSLGIQTDMLVLSSAMLPAEGSAELAETFKFSCTLEGFFAEAHVKLRPVDFPAEGLFLCGAAHYPKTLEESIAQARAAAARATGVLSKDVLQVGGVVATVDAALCTGCLTCVRICPYDAPRINPDLVGVGDIRGSAEIKAAACQGCGLCAAECPAGAIQLMHYKDEQVLAKVEALLMEA